MDVTLYLDGDPTVREEGFFEVKVSELNNRSKICNLLLQN